MKWKIEIPPNPIRINKITANITAKITLNPIFLTSLKLTVKPIPAIAIIKRNLLIDWMISEDDSGMIFVVLSIDKNRNPKINQGIKLVIDFESNFTWFYFFMIPKKINKGPKSNTLNNLTWVAITPDWLLIANEAATTWGTA